MQILPVGPNTSASLIRRVAYILQEGVATDSNSQLSPDRILENLNAEYDAMTEEVFSGPAKAELLWYLNATVSDTTTGLLDKSIDPYYVGQVVCFKRRQNETDIIPTQSEWDAVRYDPLNNYINGGGGGGVAQRANGGLYVQTPDWATWRVYFLKRPQSLSYGEAEGGTTTSITLAADPDGGQTNRFVTNAYLGDLVWVTPSDDIPQVARITAYNATTRVATCAPLGAPSGDAFTTAPASGDPYSIIPWFPPMHQELLCLRAANRFSKRPAFADFGRQLQEREAKWKLYVEADDFASQRRPRDNGRFAVGTGDNAFGTLTWWVQGNGQ